MVPVAPAHNLAATAHLYDNHHELSVRHLATRARSYACTAAASNLARLATLPVLCLLALVQPPSPSHSCIPAFRRPSRLACHRFRASIKAPLINISAHSIFRNSPICASLSSTDPASSNPTGLCCADFLSVSFSSRCRRQVQSSNRTGQPRYRPHQARPGQIRSDSK